MGESEHSLPDFDLAELESFRPETLVPRTRDSPVARFNLALALVFNDLKDFLWFNAQLAKGESEIPKQRITAARGQLNGMRLHVARRWIGLVHELLDLIKSQAEPVLETDEFRAQVNRIPRPYQRKWQALVGLALENPTGKTEDAKLRRDLERLRNKVVNHYGDTRTLAKGYRHYFHESEQGVFGVRAYVSSGRTAEETRFYFADAAAQGALYRVTGTGGSDFVSRVECVIQDVNAVLKTLVEAYLVGKETA